MGKSNILEVLKLLVPTLPLAVLFFYSLKMTLFKCAVHRESIKVPLQYT